MSWRTITVRDFVQICTFTDSWLCASLLTRFLLSVFVFFLTPLQPSAARSVALPNYYDYFAHGRDVKYCDEFSVCLSLCCLCPWLDRSSSDSIAIRYVLLVLWMTSRFHTMGQNQAWRCLEEFARRRYQLDVRQLQCLVEFVSVLHRGKIWYLRFPCLVYASLSICLIYTESTEAMIKPSTLNDSVETLLFHTQHLKILTKWRQKFNTSEKRKSPLITIHVSTVALWVKAS